MFTFIFLASFFKAGYLPVFELNVSLQFAALLVLVRLGASELGVDSEGKLQEKMKS